MTSSRETGDGLFTFRVGPKKQIFQVDKDVVAKASPVFDRMMNNGMKEAQDNIADLPEADTFTFTTFLNYAHVLQNTKSWESPKKSSGTFLSLGALQLLMLDLNYQHYKCTICKGTQDLADNATFPVCESCFQDDETLRQDRQTCLFPDCLSSILSAFQGLCCLACAKTISLAEGHDRNNRAAVQDFLYLYEVHWERLIPAVFSAPTLACDIWDRTHGADIDMRSWNLKAYTSLAVFADIYGIPDLSQKAAWTLLAKLVFFKELPPGMADLVAYVYKNTPARDSTYMSKNTSFDTIHVLRKMVSSCVAYHSSNICAQPEMYELLGTNINLAADVFGASAKILARIKHKGNLIRDNQIHVANDSDALED